MKSACPVPSLVSMIPLLLAFSLGGNPKLVSAAIAGETPWNAPAHEITTKIAAMIGGQTIADLSISNKSSLDAETVAEIRAALEREFEHAGLHLESRPEGAPLPSPASAVRIRISVSESFEHLVWIAEVTSAKAPEETPRVALIAVSRQRRPLRSPASTNVVILKSLVWEQDDPILDYAEIVPPSQGATDCSASAGAGPRPADSSTNSTTTAERAPTAPPCRTPILLMLSPSRLLVLHKIERGWGPQQSTTLDVSGVLSRDPRGRLVADSDGSFRVFLPGTKCLGRTQPSVVVDCRRSDDPWPLGTVRATFSSRANFFTGNWFGLSGGGGSVAPFFSAAGIPELLQTRPGSEAAATTKSTTEILAIFAGLDGLLHFGGADGKPITYPGWGSEIAAIRAPSSNTAGCPAPWLILATRGGDSTAPDQVQALMASGETLLPVSTLAGLDGPVTALWPGEPAPSPSADAVAILGNNAAGNLNSVAAVVRNLKTGKYEAQRLTIDCGE